MFIVLITTVILLATLFLFAVYRAPVWLWAGFLFGVVFFTNNEHNTVVWLPVAILVFFSIPPLRRFVIVRPAFSILQKQVSRVSSVEKQALTAGNPGFERGLFTGNPDWKKLRALPPLNLTDEELSVLNGPVEELCKMTDDWDIRYKKREIPEHLWNFMKENKLFGLRVPKERGGFSLSFQAQSLILGKIASRSVDVATMVELPTSLWPDEIIEKYGSDEQKKYYMPRFGESKEIISFAITGVSNGSDATAMRDVGIVEYGIHDGKKILGIRLNWKKRYITFAPTATLLVISFQLSDPNKFLEKEEDIGITLALIPTNHPGIRIGRRHLPTGVAFPNGPIEGEDVFIPIEWIVGGTAGAGQGWKMIMECLFVGRAIALPAISVSVAKIAARYSIMYARVRRQFGTPIGMFEGIEEPLARLVEMAYLTESARTVTTSMVDIGDRPLTVSSLMKYRTTEFARQAVNDAMDVHAGRAIMDGPSNYLMSAFLAAPIGVTVEGANIVTRSIITFAQGILQTHPYLYEELESSAEVDKKQGLKRFEAAFLGHISFLLSNICRAFFHNITGGIFGRAPKGVPPKVAGWYRQLWRLSASFASIADVTTILMGPRLKKKQKLGGRLADALSELFFLSSILKRYEDDGFPESDYPIVELCMRNGVYRFQKALNEAIRNFPIKPMRPLLFAFTFPFGIRKLPASDALGHTVARLVLESEEVLNRLTRYVFISNDPDDMTGRLEVAFKKSIELEGSQKKLDIAVRNGKVKRVYGVNWIATAEKEGVLTKQEATDIHNLETLVGRALAVDDFDPREIIATHEK